MVESAEYHPPRDSAPHTCSQAVISPGPWEIACALWRGRWFIIAVTIVSVLVAVAYLAMTPKWYQARVVLAPVEDRSAASIGSGLSGLATLAGVGLTGNSRTAEARAVLESEDFAREFIEQEKLLPILFGDQWDATTGDWKSKDPDHRPDSSDGASLFVEKVRRVNVNRETGLVTLTIEWTSPELASRWANTLVSRVNSKMRQRAQAEAEQNLQYLEKQMSATSLIPLQESISNLVETELQKLMLAQRTEEFSFRVIDRANPPKSATKPNALLALTLGALLGMVLSVMIVWFRDAIKKRTALFRTHDEPGQSH